MNAYQTGSSFPGLSGEALALIGCRSLKVAKKNRRKK